MTKLNVLAAHTETYMYSLINLCYIWAWKPCDKAGCESPGDRSYCGTVCFRVSTVHQQQARLFVHTEISLLVHGLSVKLYPMFVQP